MLRPRKARRTRCKRLLNLARFLHGAERLVDNDFGGRKESLLEDQVYGRLAVIAIAVRKSEKAYHHWWMKGLRPDTLSGEELEEINSVLADLIVGIEGRAM